MTPNEPEVNTPTAHLFFSYSSEGGFDVHKTLEEAKAAAAEALAYEQEDAGSDGWNEDNASSICYGRIVGGVEEKQRMPWNDHLRAMGTAEEDLSDTPRFDEYVSYELEEYTTP